MGFPEASARWPWLLFGLLLASIAATMAGIVWRATLGQSLALLTVLVLQDQHRFQSWVDQFLIVGGLLATLSRVQGVVFARRWLIALYCHSGLSKLDVSFCRELGLTLLTTAVHLFDLLVANPGSGPWLRLDLTGWSREARGVPVYPQGRACNGLAEGIAARYGGRLLIWVVQLGRADRWTGRRTSVESLGLEAIRRPGDRYQLNAHPAEASRPKPWE